MVAVESDAEDDVEVVIDDDTPSKETAVPDFDLEGYTREKVWLIFVQVGDVESSLRAVSHAHEDRLKEFSRINNYQ